VILDIAKAALYEKHYNYVLNKFLSDKVKLLFTDMDSLTYSIETDDIYDDILPDATTHFDCSEYQKRTNCTAQRIKSGSANGKTKTANRNPLSSLLASEQKCTLYGVNRKGTTG